MCYWVADWHRPISLFLHHGLKSFCDALRFGRADTKSSPENDMYIAEWAQLEANVELDTLECSLAFAS